MSFKDIHIALTYETGKDDPLNEFYIPLLSKAEQYCRIAGFFSSTSMAIAARGLAGFIKNNGKMKLIACPRISKQDFEAMKIAYSNPQSFSCDYFLKELNEISDEIKMNHLRALGWMLVEGMLEIKLAYIKKSCDGSYDDNALFHQKIGILTDSYGNKISFSGSNNETAAGWLSNVEEFKVFKSWIDGQDSYLDEDIQRFEDFWSCERDGVVIMPLPTAIKNKLIQIGKDFSLEKFASYEFPALQEDKTIRDKLSLFDYQKSAVEMWKDNGHHLLFEMATGTGKTRTAIACMNEFLEANESGLVIVSCPQVSLYQQWKQEIGSFGFDFDKQIVVGGENQKWKDDVFVVLKSLSIGIYKHCIIFTIHTMSSSDRFTSLIEENIKSTAVCFIGDEAHGLGATQAQKALLDIYSYRIGLSATPMRWFDESGTQVLIEYFGSKSFQFNIREALSTINPITNKTFLSPFEYYPIFVSLTDDELVEYQALTKRILRFLGKTDSESNEKLQRLLFQRANIEKNAALKYDALRTLFDNRVINNTLIFVSPEQIDRVMSLLHEYKISAHKFTQEQGTKPLVTLGGISERSQIINFFKKGYYGALVAMKCLDEGIDIPSAETAILMASSTNPREYVQRIGRVIRQAKNKKRAYIYDFILIPDFKKISDPSLYEFEKSIFRKELVRAQDMSSNAINNASVYSELSILLGRISDGNK